MDEFTINPTESGGAQEDVDLQNGADAGAQDEGQGQEPNADNVDQQRRVFNAAMAAARRRAEKDTGEKMRLKTDEDIAAMRIPNPAKPGSYFTSMKDLEEYSGALRRADAEKRAKATGRTTQDVLEDDEDRAFVRAQRAEAKKAEEAKKQQAERDKFIGEDIEDFRRRYPNVDIAALDTNPAFRKFAGTRYGKEHLADLYGDFVELVGEAAASAAAKSDDKAARSTGHGSGGGTGTLTAAQRAELKQWNEEHPEMAMTEKEFYER